jgi:hypothetical protein
MKTLLAVFLALALTGCASTEYVQYAKTQEAIAVAKGNADAAKYKAMSDIALSGDSAAKVAAVMAMALGQGGASQGPQIAAPAPNAALQWASILVPSITQMYGIRANADVAMRSSDNAASTSIATTAGFVGLAGQIQAPGATTTISGNSGANSGDATSTPTVVTAPDPLVVTQPAPVIVTQPAPLVVTQPVPVIVKPVVVQPAPPTIVRPEIVLTGVTAP